MYAEIENNVHAQLVPEDAPPDIYETCSDSSETLSISDIQDVHDSTMISGTCSEGQFALPKKQIKRLKRQENRLSKPSVNTSIKVPVEGFSAKVPDAFLYGCSKDTKPQFINNHLVKNSIKVKSVDLISHKDAASFSGNSRRL